MKIVVRAIMFVIQPVKMRPISNAGIMMNQLNMHADMAFVIQDSVIVTIT
jgi:hypothetical protein